MKKLTIEVKMFVDFQKYLPPDAVNGRAVISLEEGITLEELLNILGIPRDKPKMILINGLSQGVCTQVKPQTLKQGDIVSIFPPAGGG